MSNQETLYLSVQFENAYHYRTTTYTYMTDDLTVAVDDYVVVPVSNKSWPAIGKVTAVTEKPTAKATKWVISKVDLTAHEERRKRIEAKAKLEKEIEGRYKATNKMAMWEEAAKTDPKIAALLEELKSI